MKDEISLILFDFGGVIAPEGFQLGVLKLALEFGIPFEKMYELAGNRAALESGYSRGKISEKEYWKILAGLMGTDKDLMEYRYVFLDNFQPRKDMMSLIKKLRPDYDLGIFSDQTNWIYDLDEKYDFMKYFDYKFISFDTGYTKHDDQFYNMPSSRTDIKKENILVVDDKPRVIERVIKSGMNGYRFTSVSEFSGFILK